MYKSKTVFVVGAGASYEIGMPTGDGLKNNIKAALNINFEYGTNQQSGSYSIANAIKKYCKDGYVDEYNKYLSAGWHIRDAIQLAISIDNFVDNQEDEYLTKIAKLAIADTILEAEQKSLLYPKEQQRAAPQVDWQGLENTWLPYLFKTLTEGRRKSDLENIFDNLVFIIFNYDRAIEFYLAEAIELYFKVPKGTAQAVIASARFYHPYGTVGKLPWQPGEGPAANFGESNGHKLFDIAQGIITFTEQVEDKESISAIRSEINQADQILFLGFAFHDANMELLQPIRSRDTFRVIGTAYGISDNDCDVIRDRLFQLCVTSGKGAATKKSIREKFTIDNQATCAELMDKYQRSTRS